MRMVGYGRVSTDHEEQRDSLEHQQAFFQDFARARGHTLVRVYADQGISGKWLKKRDGFLQMLRDAERGEFELVVVKDISRFARNTVTLLEIVREMKALGVAIVFEKENIDTGTLTSELMVSVSASLAQEESISISKNQRMSYQRRMERGEFITCSAPFGYQIVDGKNLTIVEDQAKIVKWIFAAYLRGYSSE